MDLSHRRSASTATNNFHTSDLQPHRLRTRSGSDASPGSDTQRRKLGDNELGSGSEVTSSDDMELGDLLSEDDGLEDDEETGLTSGDRRKRRRRKRRNTLLDNRIVPAADHGKQWEEEEKLANEAFWSKVIVNSSLIGAWYFFSISITLYNKWMFKSETGEPDIVFPFPLFTTCVHMIVQFTSAALVLYFFPKYRPRHDSVNPHAPISQRRQEPTDPSKPIMTRWFYISRIGPCGAATGLDIGLGNMSLKFISMTFYTMCKSSVLGFVLLFAFLFRLETPSWKLFFIIVTMTAGVVLMVAGETAFDVLGFVLVMTAAASSGFRWSLTQILLIRNPATSNPFSTLFFLAPVMFFTLLIVAVPVEGVYPLAQAFHTLAAAKGYALSAGILLFPGVLAFLMTSSEFALLQRTSVVTLSICGIFKEVLTIAAGTIAFNDRLTLINFAGLAITILTIGVYNYLKIKKMREDAERDAHISVSTEGMGGYARVEGNDEEGRRNDERRNSGRGGGGAGGRGGHSRAPSGVANLSAPGRSSMGDLVRNSLSLATRAVPGKNDPSPTKGPMKRPENLE